MPEIVATFVDSNGDPVAPLADDPEVQIRRTDTGAIVQAFDAMTSVGDGTYVYSYAVPLTTNDYSFVVNGDPTASGQVPDSQVTKGGSFPGLIDANEASIATNLDAAISTVVTAIGALNDLSIADVQTAMDNQGFTAARAILLDNLDASISSVITAISGLNDLSIADVQTALTTQGYTAARALLLDNLDATVSSVLTAIGALNDISAADVDTLLSASHGAGSWEGSNLVGYQDAAIWIDVTNGAAGSVVGTNGTASNPVNNLADAVLLAAATGFRAYVILSGFITLTSAHTNWTFIGKGGEDQAVTFGGQDVSGSYFIDIWLDGTMVVTTGVHVVRGLNWPISGFRGTMWGTMVQGSIIASGPVNLIDCKNGLAAPATGPVIDVSAVSLNAPVINGWDGNLEIAGMTAGEVGTVSLNGHLTLGPSNTGGTLNVSGVGELTDTSAGLVVDSTALVTQDSANLSGYMDGSVWIDTGAGTPGTVVGVNGTADNPVDTIADAETLATAIGLRAYTLVGSYVLVGTDHTRWSFFGRGDSGVILIAGDVSGSTFKDVALFGAMTATGPCIFKGCNLGDITGFNGYVHGCIMQGTLTAPPAISSIMHFGNCSNGHTKPSPGAIIDCGPAGTFALGVHNFGGSLEIRGLNTAAKEASVDLKGTLTLTATNTAGTLKVSGVGELIDGSAGTVVDDSAFITEASLVDAVYDESAADHVANGSFGQYIVAAGGASGGLHVTLDGGSGVVNADYTVNNQLRQGRLRFFDTTSNASASTPGNVALETGELFRTEIQLGDASFAAGNLAAVPEVLQQLIRRGP